MKLFVFLLLTSSTLSAQNLPGSNLACLTARYRQANLDALTSYSAKIAAKGDSIAYYYALRGAAYYHLGDMQSGLKDCDSAITIDPQCFAAYQTKLDMYYQLKDADGAKQAANAAIKIHSNSSNAWLLMSTVGEMTRDRNKQRLAIDKALEYDPNNALANCYLGVWYARLGKSKLGLLYVNKSIAADSNHAYYYYVRSTILRDLKDWTNAIADADRAMAMDSCYTEIQFTKAEIYQLKGDYNAAVEWFTIFIDGNPPYARGYAKRGYCYHQLKNREKAAVDLLQGADMGDEDAIYMLRQYYPEEYVKFMR